MKTVAWVLSPSCVVTFFCRHCGELADRHLDGKCLFQASMFEYEPRAQIAKRLLTDRFAGEFATPKVQEEMAAFLKQTLRDLERNGIPDKP